MRDLVAIILLAFLLDLVLGDPRYRLHPIRLMGRCILIFTKILRHSGMDGRVGGILLVAMTQIVFLTGYLTAAFIFYRLNTLLGLLFDLFVCYSCLALKDLFCHTNRVLQALMADDLSEARARIAMVVGRDVRFLDKIGICRAAIETLGENYVDGFLSPLFWYVCGGIAATIMGLPQVTTAVMLMLAFKVTSTLDSMVGYKDPEFLKLGWAGAKLDDVMNFIPARLSLVILCIGAFICRTNPLAGIKTALRDRLKHDSPNSAHAESFVAGALHVQLGGPTVYPEGQKEKPWLGEGNLDPLPIHIRKTGLLLKCSAWVGVAISVSAIVLFT